MVFIKNGFEIEVAPIGNEKVNVWTKEPSDLEGKCIGLYASTTSSFEFVYLADRSDGTIITYFPRTSLPKDSTIISIYLELIKEYIGPGKPIGISLSPQKFAVFKSLYDLAANIAIRTMHGEVSITDIVIRDLRTEPATLSDEQTQRLLMSAHDPKEHCKIYLTADLYSNQ
jgi:hypothetical protein